MSDRQNAVVAGSLAEIKFVKSRSVCVLCIEIPIELSEDAIAKFGVPLPGREIPVALALIQTPPGPAPAADSGPSTASVPPITGAVPGRGTEKSERAKEVYRDADPVTKATMDAGRMRLHPKYRGFLDTLGLCAVTKEGARNAQHMLFGVKSCVEFHSNPEALKKFREHETSFKIFIGEIPEPR